MFVLSLFHFYKIKISYLTNCVVSSRFFRYSAVGHLVTLKIMLKITVKINICYTKNYSKACLQTWPC